MTNSKPLAQGEGVPAPPSALNIVEGIYLHDDGLAYPVTNWIGADGDECGRYEAVTCVAGYEGRWFALDLSDFETGARA